jgi:serine phosphatase RsbU (regulator of sigma subunit)
VLVGALRNARRAGTGLAEQARLASAGLGDFAQDGGFVTGQLVRIDLATGTALMVNAGHPPPLRLRDGRVERLDLLADPPFGTVPDYEYREQPLPLLPGDRIMFVTDGMLERNAASVDIAALMEAAAGLHPREAVQHLIRAVLQAVDGELADDAAALCLDWHGGPPRGRSSASGANQ